jgi:hypothetical protein
VRGLGRVVISQWFTMVSGLLLTAVAAALVFALVPPSYTSSGTVIVIPPSRPTNKATNPLLALDSNLDTVALIVLQSLSSPVLPFRVGLVEGQDDVTITQGGIGPTASAGPFISITAKSPDASRSPAIVSWVIALARQDLADWQHHLKVANRKSVTLESVVEPTPAKPVWLAPVSATGGTLLLGLMLSTAMAWSMDWAAARRRRHELAPVVPLEGVGYPPSTQMPRPATPAVRPAAVALSTGGLQHQAG